MPLNHLYLDLNSFFASCEQQEKPQLRGKPVAVLPLMSEGTSAIAASYEAKRFGIKTGTSVADMRALCPDIIFVTGNHKTYIQYHHRVLEAVEQCIPIESVRSIDEVSCRLMGDEKEPEKAIAIAKKIKRVLREQVGECMTASIGLAPNVMLAKLASDMQKPDGLTMLTSESLPQSIYHLKLNDIPGIGRQMLKRLYKFGIYDIETLYKLDAMRMRGIWGGVAGARFRAELHGEDIERAETNTSCFGHQHVLEPALRNRKGGVETTKKLLAKAAERMRGKGFYCRSLTLHVKLAEKRGYFVQEARFQETQDTAYLLAQLETLWSEYAHTPPHRVGIVLAGLVAESHHQMSLFEKPRKTKALGALDAINQRYGRGTIHFGMQPQNVQKVDKDKIAFSRVPKLYEAG